MSVQNTITHRSNWSGETVLGWSAKTWFIAAAVGQLAFIGFILAYYGVRTLSGDLAAWNDKPLIDGHIEGDGAGNAMFGLHVFLAAIMTSSGLIQLIPAVRARWPRFHHISGRTFLVTACLLALGGLWLGLVRGTYLSVSSMAALGVNAILILAFTVPTLRHAMARRIDQHRRWALRLFMVANGVWFLRIGLTVWPLLAGGPVGMNRTMSGPADVVLTFGCYLIPLAVLEVYFAAQRSETPLFRFGAAALVFTAASVTALGVFTMTTFLWLPYI